MLPGIAPPSWVFAQFIHNLVYTPYTPDLARAGVIGACSHTGPGSPKVPRAYGVPELGHGS